uniref:Protein OSCP1 n=1 Tax=Plectus sambesii TaxID=2011161 RepID=A0A914VVS4_9BILA
MSLRTMPILFLNMGGEMAYILEQRLQAQSVRNDKSVKVMGDILSTMFNKKFLDELFKPQELYSRRNMRAFFEKLAHASIMRLNQTSMDKLYDLMTMAVKYQLQSCASPREMLLITLNHLDGVRKMVQNDAKLQTLIDYAFSLLEKQFFAMTTWELMLVRTTLLNFYQDARVKVSLLLREKKQNEEGRFFIDITNMTIPHGATLPGSVRYFEEGAFTKTTNFEATGTFVESPALGSLEKTVKKGERLTALGMNMYKSGASTEVKGGVGSSAAGDETSKESDAKDELNLLSHLIQSNAKKGKADKGDFALSLFETEEDEVAFVEEAKKGAADDDKVVRIDASKRDKRSMEKMIGDMGVKERKPRKDKGQDILDMMDEAEERDKRPSTSKSRPRTSSSKGPRPTTSRPASSKRRASSKNS